MTRSTARGCLWVVFVFFILTIGVWLFRTSLMSAAAAFLVENDGPHHADAAVVLGGDEYGNRVLTAAALARNQYVPFVLISFPMSFGACDSGSAYAVAQGYAPALFRELPHHSKSTRDEVQVLDAYFREHGIRSILLVTSNYHTHRAAWLMRRQDARLQVWAIPAPDPYFSPQTWWKTREGEKTFLLEWTKTVAAWLGD